MSGIARRRALIRKLRPYPEEAYRRAALRARSQNLTYQEAEELAMLEERFRPWHDARMDEACRWLKALQKKGLSGKPLTPEQREQFQAEHEIRHAPSKWGKLLAYCWNKVLRDDLNFMIHDGMDWIARYRSRKKNHVRRC